MLERFFDESGGMQLVLHAPFGSRVNRAWGLALRKRFCRQFNFELQAAATEDALLLSLGPQHSFPLADVFRYLHPATARDVLMQAFLDAPVFQTRWRWNATDLAGRAAQSRRQEGAAAAAADAGRRSAWPRSSPTRRPASRTSRATGRFRIIRWSTRRCATASKRRWTSTALAAVLTRIHARRDPTASRATRPSRRRSRTRSSTRGRTRSSTMRRSRSGGRRPSTTRRAGDPVERDDLGALDAAAIERVRDEARPDPRDADELHDALLTAGFLTQDEVAHADAASAWLDALAQSGVPHSPPTDMATGDLGGRRAPARIARRPRRSDRCRRSRRRHRDARGPGRARTRSSSCLRGRLALLGPDDGRSPLACAIGPRRAEPTQAPS